MRAIRAALPVAAVVIAVVVLVLAVRYHFTRLVPAGQAPLADLKSTTLDSLRSDFNRVPKSVRIILLLSPT